MWIEVAMSFSTAAINAGTLENLSKVPATASGLQWFIQAAKLPDQMKGLFDSRHLHRCSSAASHDALKEPKPLGKLSDAKYHKFMRNRDEDKHKTIILDKILQAPYWG